MASGRYAARARFLEGLDALMLVGSKERTSGGLARMKVGCYETRGPGAGVRVEKPA